MKKDKILKIIETWIDRFNQIDDQFNLNSEYTKHMVDFVCILDEESHKQDDLERIFYEKFSWNTVCFLEDVDNLFFSQAIIKARTVVHAMLVSNLIGNYYHPTQFGNSASELIEFVLLITRSNLVVNKSIAVTICTYYRYYMILLFLAIVSFIEYKVGENLKSKLDIVVKKFLCKLTLEKKYPKILTFEENSATRKRVYHLMSSKYDHFDRNIIVEIESLLL